MTTTKDLKIDAVFDVNINISIKIGEGLKKPEILAAMDDASLQELSAKYSELETSIQQQLQYFSDWEDALIGSSNKLETFKEVLNKEIEARKVFTE